MTEPKKPAARKRKPAAPKDSKPKAPAKRKKTVAQRSVVVGSLWCIVAGVVGVVAGVFFAGGVKINPEPKPSDVLSQAYDADRVTQIAVLKELAEQPFDGSTDEGLKSGTDWFNAQRFRNRADDFGGFTDAVAEAISKNAEADLAAKLEGGK
jgi:hypothetical protein